ncbi:MAG: hypothetical protein R3B36_12560 [Polyangiaceae bacterium]
MTHPGLHPRKNKLVYGLNQADEWWPFADPTTSVVRDRVRQVHPKILRIFLYDKHGPNPLTNWPDYRLYVQTVLDVGATPMITFAKMDRPYFDDRALRSWAEQCADVVWQSMRHWGPEAVTKWYWAVWNEPNSTLIGGGLSFEQYARIYTAVARRCTRWLAPYLGGKRPLFGGPGIEAFQPLWLDWAYRFCTEIDQDLLGFLDWHTYGEWREEGEYGSTSNETHFRELMLWVTHDYEARARMMGRLARAHKMLNICGEHNANSHQSAEVRRRFNNTRFTAAFNASALIHLMRGGADAELFWAGVDSEGGYGMLDLDGTPRPVFHAKRLAADYVQTGDEIVFPVHEPWSFDSVVATSPSGRRSAYIAHLREDERSYPLSELAPGVKPKSVYVLDGTTGGDVKRVDAEHTLTIAGQGVCVITDEDAEPHR